MRKFILYCCLGLALLNTSSVQKKEWEDLFDPDLSKWEMYLSYRHKPGYKGEVVTDSVGNPAEPIGYNRNVNEVFTVIQENGTPVVRISGEIYGCIFTKQEYENYHLKLKFKWGRKKWPPRLDDKMDSGILYHSQGKCGVDYWKSWMLSQELQLIEGGIGDYWSIANSISDIKAVKKDSNYIYSQNGAPLSFGEGTGNGNFCMAGRNAEHPSGEWNTVELICFGNNSIYIANGQVVMTLSNSRFKMGKAETPLTKGKIQLQSEAAEVFFKEAKIKSITGIPEQFKALFK